jgi:hypothetical protein
MARQVNLPHEAGAPDQYGIVGHPVAHSWSPFIHGMFAIATAQNLVYRLFDIAPDDFRRETLRLFTSGVRGLNITLPHKQAAAELLRDYGVAADGSDPTGDGVSNTNKFLAGFNPTNSAAYAHILSVVTSGINMNITYLGANGDTSYAGGPTTRTNVLEFTAGTGDGSYTNAFASTGQTNILSGGNGLGVVTNMVDGGGATNMPSRYYRVRVLAP